MATSWTACKTPAQPGSAAPGPSLRRTRLPRSGAAAFLLLPLLLLPTVRPTPLVAQIPPDAAWRTLETEHFRLTFPEGLEVLAQDAAVRAERALSQLGEALVEPPSGRIEILLTDYADTSNGFAGVAPYRMMTIYARPPVDGFALSHFDDWLQMVVTHELAHVLHLDVTSPLGRALRTVFGRVPIPWPFFPHLSTPRWAVEGVATWYESALTGAGRTKGTYHEMVLRTAVLEGRFEHIDQASGESPAWPAGQRPYVYGSLFFDYLVDRYGEEGVARFVQELGGQLLPWRLNAAAREAFGVSFSQAWREWRERLEEEGRGLEAARAGRAPLTDPEAVTVDARMATQPRLSPGGETVVYARSDGRSDAQLRRTGRDGSGGDMLVRTNGTATWDFLPDGRIVLSQLERSGAWRLYSDLWIVDPDGTSRRITREGRIEHPSAAPDGRNVVAIRNGGGTTELVVVSLPEADVRSLRPPEPDVHWAYPAVSPDGRWIAAARWRDGAYFDVVILDRDGRLVAEVTRDRAMDTAPTWSPDGRWLLWVSDRSGIQNVLAAPVDPGSGRPGELRQATNLLTGAHFPSVSPDGRWLYLSVYHVDGWEVERLPFEPDGWFEPFPLDPRFLEEPVLAPTVVDGASTSVEDYSALPTVRPRYWQPAYRPPVSTRGVEVIGPSWGLLTGSRDLVGRHALDLELALSTSGARLSGVLGYSWAGLGNPLLSVQVGQAWDVFGPFTLGEGEEARRVFVDERERAVVGAATFHRERVRRSLSLTASGALVQEDRSILEDDFSSSTARLANPRSRLVDVSLTAGFATARGHAFSIGPEEGLAGSVRLRRRQELDVPGDRRGVAGEERSVDDLVGVLRAYQDVPGPGFADHVLAFRASGGAARGPGADAFWFDVGGASGAREPITGMGLFGGSALLFPARGWLNGERGGRYAWSASAEYRIPLALVNRGLGLFPIHLDRLSGSLFADAANAWGPELDVPGFQNPRRDPLLSAGAELTGEFLSFFSIPLTVRAGWAARLAEGSGSALYVRLGRSF